MIIKLENAPIEQIIKCVIAMNTKRMRMLFKNKLSQRDVHILMKDLKSRGYNALMIKDACVMPCVCNTFPEEFKFPF